MVTSLHFLRETLWGWRENRESTSEYQLPKSVMKWVALGLLLSSAVVIAISILSGVKFSDLPSSAI